MCLQSLYYWWQLSRCASNPYIIGGNSLDVPPILILLVATLSMCLQSLYYWWQLSRCASNPYIIGGNLLDVPPIFIKIGGKIVYFPVKKTIPVTITSQSSFTLRKKKDSAKPR